MQLKDLPVLITGGASGLGAATAKRLAGSGAKVAIFDTNDSDTEALAEEIGGLGCLVDVTDDHSVVRGLEAVTAEFSGPPRVVVNCAGIGLAARVVGREGKLSIELFEKTIAVNLVGTFRMMSYCARAMTALEPLGSDGERGVIINTSSIAFEDGQFGQTAYAASKGGISSLCLPAARELGREGIRVMSIAPGLFETSMTEGFSEEIKSGIVASIPFPRRLGQADEYALMVEQIIGNPFVNGSTYRLDGGMRLPVR